MERKILLNEIAAFCFKYQLLDKSISVNEIKDRIEKQLSDSTFIESLINTIIVRAKNDKTLNIERLKSLLLELERLRLEMEYTDEKR